MTVNSRHRLYATTGWVAVAVGTALFSLPFVIVAIFLIERAYGAG